MIIFCEECGKKYKIDETKIVGEKSRCKCQSCGHIMEVVKSAPEVTADETAEQNDSAPDETSFGSTAGLNDEMPAGEHPPQAPPLKGLSLNLKLLLNFLGFMVLFGGLLTYIYMSFVPTLLAAQINARANSVARACAIALDRPLGQGDNDQINKITKDMSALPGVAYIAVSGGGINLTAGELSEAAKDTLSRNSLKGAGHNLGDLEISGQKIHDAAARISSSGTEVHVGLYLQQGAMKQDVLSLAPLLVILATLLILGALSFMQLANSISKPIKELAAAAQRISLGELDLSIQIKGGGEIQELASSLERMRFSIKSAIERLRRR